MCNIAGYIGPRPAAAELIAMMQREAGFGGGYYSGLATVDGGVHWAKCLGDMDRLVATTDAAKLPGNTGICHSRSNSGGDDAWAHPFVSNDGRLAYVANGSYGVYPSKDTASDVTRTLEARGIRFDSAAPDKVGHYPVLSTGKGVHVSETMCHLIRQDMLDFGLDCGHAMAKAYAEFPSEIVGLCVTEDAPGKIWFARINQPMMLGRTKDEVFLATTAMAFPTDREYISIRQIPKCTAGYVTRDEFVCYPFETGLPVAELTPGVWHDAMDLAAAAMDAAEKPLSVGELCRAVRPAFPEGEIPQTAPVAYEILRQWKTEGKLEILAEQQPGAPEGAALGITTTQLTFCRKK